jgi:N-acetylglucosaminyl-diphospho-decaprenol L-rhamnosyltransferase
MNPAHPQAPSAPLVSAILVGYNQAASLRRAIEALERSQNREQLEILVVDCASRDETPSLDEHYPSLTLLRLPQHFGATKALNIGTRTARGELLFFLSPDVEVAPDTIRRLVEALESASDATAVCPLLVSPDGNPVWRVLPLPTRDVLARICAGDPPFTSVPTFAPDLTPESIAVAYPGRDVLLVRRHFVAGMNYFDERLGEYWADADLALQIHRAGKKIRLYPRIRATWHATPDPEPRDTLHMSDRIVGAGVLLGKYRGLFAGIGYRFGATLKALASFNFPLFFALLNGRKMNASQAG